MTLRMGMKPTSSAWMVSEGERLGSGQQETEQEAETKKQGVTDCMHKGGSHIVFAVVCELDVIADKKESTNQVDREKEG